MEEIKQGYKQTDIGLIPEDWISAKVRNFCRMKSGNMITAESISSVGNYPCYGGNGLRGYTKSFSHDGEFALIGRQGALCGNVNYVTGKFYASEHAIVTTPVKPNNIKFLSYSFIRMNLNQYTESSAQPGLSVMKILDLPINVPKSHLEQTAIATTLSDTDALISALDKKIAKKQQIKQGAMQQLLTGKKRLSGFGEEWVEKAFGEMLTIKHGRDQKLIECVIGKYPILGTGGIIGQTNTPLYSKPSVLIGRKGTIDKPYYYDTPFWTVDTLFFSEIKANFDAKFIYYIFNLIDWYKYNEASGVPSLNAKVIESIRIYVPSTLKEQTGIAEILTDMDQEIAQLEKERDKYVQLKSGLMQVLLTGKVRLVKLEN